VVLGGEVIEFIIYKFIKANPARPLNNDIKFEFVNRLIFIIILIKKLIIDLEDNRFYEIYLYNKLLLLLTTRRLVEFFKFRYNKG